VTADVGIFSDHIFKEDAVADRLIQDLCEGQFELEKREESYGGGSRAGYTFNPT
jgi:hypothetical protein